MLRLLASRLLKKRLPAAWKSGTQRWEDEREWRAKRDGSLPRDHACRRQQPCLAQSSGDFGTSPPNGGRPSDESAAYLSPTGAANSKDCCHLSNAASHLCQRATSAPSQYASTGNRRAFVGLYTTLGDRHDRPGGVANELVSFATALASRFQLPKGTDQACAKANNKEDKAERLRNISHRFRAIFEIQ